MDIVNTNDSKSKYLTDMIVQTQEQNNICFVS